jgi:DNA processing protein
MPDLADWLTLWRGPGVRSATFAALMGHFGSSSEILRVDYAGVKCPKLPDETIIGIRQPDRHEVEQDLAWAAQTGHFILRLSDPDYPPRLRQISIPPPLLFTNGNLRCLSDPQIAIHGQSPAQYQSDANMHTHLLPT